MKKVEKTKISPVLNLIDVGAVGSLPSPWKENTRHIHHLLKFEPREAPVKEENVISMDVALWEANCVKDFYIYNGFNGQGSSLFQQNIQYVEENFETLKNRGSSQLANTWLQRSQLERTVKVECRKLDDILSEMNREIPFHFLKVDAQGAEYQVLKGAQTFLSSSSCLGLHLELFVVPLYKGITLLAGVEEYLRGFGFSLEKTYPAHGSFDSQHDCLFLKKNVEGESKDILDLIKDIYRWDEVREIYRNAVKAFKIGDYNRGKENFEKVIKSDIPDVDLVADAWFFQGEMAKQENESGWENAFNESLSLLLDLAEKNEPRAYRIASIYKRLSRFPQALEWFDTVLKMSANKNTMSAAYFHRGEILYMEKEFGKAKTAFEKTMELNPHHKKAKEYLGRLT